MYDDELKDSPLDKDERYYRRHKEQVAEKNKNYYAKTKEKYAEVRRQNAKKAYLKKKGQAGK